MVYFFHVYGFENKSNKKLQFAQNNYQGVVLTQIRIHKIIIEEQILVTMDKVVFCNTVFVYMAVLKCSLIVIQWLVVVRQGTRGNILCNVVELSSNE
jgi:hypothetical protein